MHHEAILIIDFGSQYTQLIARRLRELNVYCEIHPFNHLPDTCSGFKGVILSGGPASVRDKNSPRINLNCILNKVPVLGICYGAQLLAQELGGEVKSSQKREYGRAVLNIVNSNGLLFKKIRNHSQIWMSHSDSISRLPKQFETIAATEAIPCAAYQAAELKVFGLQFHPEVVHTDEGKEILKNFAFDVCQCTGDWTPASFVAETIQSLKMSLHNDKVILGLSGGVDSGVAALLLHKAIGENLYCIFVDTGLLRKDEAAQVIQTYGSMGLQIIQVDASWQFYGALKGKTDPEEKRKIIGRLFIEVFERKAREIENVKWLAQGTIYPDVIESVSVNGPSATIKSHHNVGGLPEKMNLKITEPLRLLFKDEVRKVGNELNMKPEILNRHPFPGPGLGIRILGEVNADKVRMLQEADQVFIENLRQAGLYNNVWQAAAILLPVKSVGVMGDERTYENVVVLRAVSSVDGMTADWVHLPYDFLAKTSNDIINKVNGINRVVYDISSKPPATIEWE
ncbi:MAG: glutamine-hydrolyzing GMP synthase [Bacteroidia bacterium]|nr:glutamine-hydrolyzing GMP synthase [Bacteroidia bacterium]MCZ2277696.1 glutamine-hydrolyzing GMP synthase [Bacteroidia bacterium]